MSERMSIMPEPITYIGEGGVGGEATVDIELRNSFPGLGGTVITRDGVICATRKQNSGEGHRTFLTHLIIKKLEDHFFRRGDGYAFSHIPRPLGSFSKKSENAQEISFYEWVHGKEGFPWEVMEFGGDRYPVELSDWRNFTGRFMQAGFNLEWDVTDADDGRVSKNIIHCFPGTMSGSPYPVLPSTWKRIDFGSSSIVINYEKLSRFLHDNRYDISQTLTPERYEMVAMSTRYLMREALTKSDLETLEERIGRYRSSSIKHYLKGLVPAKQVPVLYKGDESL